jgi:NADH:ubiquinone oxidoreductase subunit 6 (subunit J)
MSTSITIATALINWNDLWKIILAAVVGGSGVVIVFGLMLLGISRGKTAARPATRYGLYTLSGVCGFIVVAVAAVGIFAMTQKPSSAKPKPKAAAVAPAGSTREPPARTA